MSLVWFTDANNNIKSHLLIDILLNYMNELTNIQDHILNITNEMDKVDDDYIIVLGNIIGSVLSADVYARYCRMNNYDTLSKKLPDQVKFLHNNFFSANKLLEHLR